NWVPIAAPGANITTTLTDPKTGAQWGYMPVGGTSLAAPVVAGIAGLLFSTNSGASASSVTNALYRSVDPVNGTTKVAYGRVNAYKALVAFGAAAPPTSQPPASTAPPAISGTAQQGQTLSASTGTWANSPTAYAYQWKRCASDGTACSAITGATTQTYLLGSADVGSALVVAVTASNSAGSATAVSAPTAPVAATPAPPANTAPPAISGTAQQAQTLSASTGSWSGSPTAFAYQWERCAADGTACSAVAGATGQTYLLGSADVASALVVAVTASNTAGSATATSASTAPVSGAVATQTFSGSLNKKNTTASFPATVGAGSAQASASFSAKCSSLTLTVLTSTGTVVGQSSGPSVLSRTDTLAAGTYTYRVSGTCTTSVTLVVSAPAA